jgi:hypothetical protein
MAARARLRQARRHGWIFGKDIAPIITTPRPRRKQFGAVTTRSRYWRNPLKWKIQGNRCDVLRFRPNDKRLPRLSREMRLIYEIGWKPLAVWRECRNVSFATLHFASGPDQYATANSTCVSVSSPV